MTIDEAIEHARNVAEANDGCTKCAEEHEQLAMWLEELKELRELIKAYENAPSDAYWYEKGRADAINAIKNDLHNRITEEMNNPYQYQNLCQGLLYGIQRCDWYLDDSKEQKE